MLIEIPEVLSADELQQARQLLADAHLTDDRITAGSQSAHDKQLDLLNQLFIYKGL